MSKVFVQFSDASESTVISVFAGPQDPGAYPFQAELEDADARYLAFINPPAPVPAEVTRFQGRAALYLAGKLSAVESYMSLPNTPPLEKMAWDDAQAFERNSATVAAMAKLLGLSASDVDSLFVSAANIKA